MGNGSVKLMSLAKKSVLVLKADTTLSEASAALDARGVGCSLVSDGKGHIIGILTDRDIVCKGLAQGLPRSAKISRVMAKDLVFISEDKSIEEAVEVMKKNGLRRLPVLRVSSHGKNRCIGLLSLDDLILSKAIELQDLAEIVRRQLKKDGRRSGRPPNRQRKRKLLAVRKPAGSLVEQDFSAMAPA